MLKKHFQQIEDVSYKKQQFGQQLENCVPTTEFILKN